MSRPGGHSCLRPNRYRPRQPAILHWPCEFPPNLRRAVRGFHGSVVCRRGSSDPCYSRTQRTHPHRPAPCQPCRPHDLPPARHLLLWAIMDAARAESAVPGWPLFVGKALWKASEHGVWLSASLVEDARSTFFCSNYSSNHGMDRQVAGFFIVVLFIALMLLSHGTLIIPKSLLTSIVCFVHSPNSLFQTHFVTRQGLFTSFLPSASTLLSSPERHRPGPAGHRSGFAHVRGLLGLLGYK
jgi:hypothetical protein